MFPERCFPDKISKISVSASVFSFTGLFVLNDMLEKMRDFMQLTHVASSIRNFNPLRQGYFV
jgi:hypothetical protein